MPFYQDGQVPAAAGPTFGTYQTTFRSERGQVYAHLFERRGGLIAHVAFSPGVKAEEATDPYYTELQDYAREHGYAGRLRLVYADQ